MQLDNSAVEVIAKKLQRGLPLERLLLSNNGSARPTDHRFAHTESPRTPLRHRLRRARQMTHGMDRAAGYRRGDAAAVRGDADVSPQGTDPKTDRCLPVGLA